MRWGRGGSIWSKEDQRSVLPGYAIDSAPGRVETLSIVASGKVGEVSRLTRLSRVVDSKPEPYWVPRQKFEISIP